MRIETDLDGETVAAIERHYNRAKRAQIEGALRGRVSALPDPDVRTYTTPEVARLLRVSIPTVNRMKRAGRLRTVCVNGATRICASSLAQLGV